ncbi:MAG: TylF/MycF/NovP-related O-methyltransferase [Flavobacteriales bacterium]
MGRIKNIKIKALKAVSKAFGAFPFFIQGRMDIDSKSLWFDPGFNKDFGGYYPEDKSVKRTLARLPNHDHVRQDMLHLLCKSVIDRNVPGAIAELGVFRGETARLFHHYMPERTIYLLDTFEGFDAKDVNVELKSTGQKTTTTHFSNTSEQLVLEAIGSNNQNIRLIKGFFPESVTEELSQQTFAMVHLDADLYQPTLEGLKFFFPRLNSGGLLIVHDYNAWFGARKAVEEYSAENSLIPIPMPDKSGSCVFLKS